MLLGVGGSLWHQYTHIGGWVCKGYAPTRHPGQPSTGRTGDVVWPRPGLVSGAGSLAVSLHDGAATVAYLRSGGGWVTGHHQLRPPDNERGPHPHDGAVR